MRSTHFFICLLVLAMTACHDAGKKQDSVTTDALYMDYSIEATENGNAVCMFRFRTGGRNGRAVLLGEASRVELDGELLKADSARFAGVYYETVHPVQGFAGKHKIAFITTDKNQYTEDFEFLPFELETELPAAIPRKPFVIRLKNFPLNETQMHLVMMDTSFLSNDVNQNISVLNGEVEIGESMLRQLKKGPVSLELTRDESMFLNQKTKAGGRFWISYGLKRDFELVN